MKIKKNQFCFCFDYLFIINNRNIIKSFCLLCLYVPHLIFALCFRAIIKTCAYINAVSEHAFILFDTELCFCHLVILS